MRSVRCDDAADVASSVRRLGLEYEEEAIDEESGYSIDILVSHSGEHGDHVGAGKIALEVDGPSHYLLPGRRTANGNTVLKTRVLSMPGYKSVSVPFWDWDGLEGQVAKDAYLRKVLGMA